MGAHLHRRDKRLVDMPRPTSRHRVQLRPTANSQGIQVLLRLARGPNPVWCAPGRSLMGFPVRAPWGALVEPQLCLQAGYCRMHESPNAQGVWWRSPGPAYQDRGTWPFRAGVDTEPNLSPAQRSDDYPSEALGCWWRTTRVVEWRFSAPTSAPTRRCAIALATST